MMTNASDSGSCLFQLEVAPTGAQALVQFEDPRIPGHGVIDLPSQSDIIIAYVDPNST